MTWQRWYVEYQCLLLRLLLPHLPMIQLQAAAPTKGSWHPQNHCWAWARRACLQEAAYLNPLTNANFTTEDAQYLCCLARHAGLPFPDVVLDTAGDGRAVARRPGPRVHACLPPPPLPRLPPPPPPIPLPRP
jgi:hypothetical protein